MTDRAPPTRFVSDDQMAKTIGLTTEEWRRFQATHHRDLPQPVGTSLKWWAPAVIAKIDAIFRGPGTPLAHNGGEFHESKENLEALRPRRPARR
jgi:hypothetical protein